MPSMKRFTGLLNRTKSQNGLDNAPPDSPEANASRSIRLFCESGSAANRDEEVLHLPVIVEAAESSPQAAAAAAHQIRKFLGSREFLQKPHVQYNSIMLVRILCDNPGPTFTRSFDKAFVGAVKDCLRNSKDGSVQQILRETLDHLEAEKAYDEGLAGLIAMWRKEKGPQASMAHAAARGMAPRQQSGGPWDARGQGNGYGPGTPSGGGIQRASGGGGSRRNRLPPPIELAGRIEEARNSAKILLQLISSTPQEEVMTSELIAEFAERCQGAQRSMQGYIGCDSPPPDDDTMLTLIETNEQLSLASSRHQRAILAARRSLAGNVYPQQQNGNVMPLQQQQQQQQQLQLAQPTQLQPQLQQPQTQRESVMFAQSQPPQIDGYSSNEFGSGAFGSGTEFDRREETYNPPPGPPPSVATRFGQREPQQNPPPKSQFKIQHEDQQPSNPFEDPIEHQEGAAPLAYDTQNTQAPQHFGSLQQQQQQRQHRFSTNSLDPSSTYSSVSNNNNTTHEPNTLQRRETLALENAYANPTYSPSISAPSPDLHSRSPVFGRPQEQYGDPQISPNRPQFGSAWGNGGVTQSYVGRQNSAVNGLTMHGAGRRVSEIDSHSQVGRTGGESNERESMYSVSPVETRR